jgi:hypothetical protein
MTERTRGTLGAGARGDELLAQLRVLIELDA